jgi:hypothetical protein
MIRYFAAAVAAAVLTTGAVASLAATPDQGDLKVTVSKAGDYCVHAPAVGGSMIGQTTCRSQADWAKDGVTFTRR